MSTRLAKAFVPPAPGARSILVLFLLGALLVVPSAGHTEGAGTSPNLVPYPPGSISSGRADNHPISPPYALRFSVTTANRGQVPLDFKSEQDPKDPTRTVAAQCVRWLLDRQCTRRSPAGEFVFHNAPGHYHFHIADFALYELRALRQDGEPDMSPQGLVAGGQKVSFCVQDTDTDSATSSVLWPPNPIYYLCQNGRQGISPGHADTYSAGLEGQQIVLPEGIQDGVYAVVVTIDPTDRFYEWPRQDNVAHTLVEIRQGGAVAFAVYQG